MKNSFFYVIEFKGNYTPVNYHRYYFNFAEAIKEANTSLNEFLHDCFSRGSKVINDFENKTFGYLRQVVVRDSDGFCYLITLSVHRLEFFVK